MNASLSTEDIYTWKNAYSVSVPQDVIFNGFCWKILRTTDTGGVKLVFNGIPSDEGTCDYERPFVHGPSTAQNGEYLHYYPTNDYTYGTSYTYDASANRYHIAGSKFTAKWANSANSIVGKYMSSGEYSYNFGQDVPGWSIYYIHHISPKNGYPIIVSYGATNSNTSAGDVAYNPDAESPSSVGYMYNKERYTDRSDFYTINSLNSYIESHDITIATSFTDMGDGTYKMINPKTIKGSDIYKSSSRNYIWCVNMVGIDDLCSSQVDLHYIIDNDESNKTFTYVPGIQRFYGSGITYSGGKYTLVNPTSSYNLTASDPTSFINNHRYYCDNGAKSCTEVTYILGEHLYDKSGMLLTIKLKNNETPMSLLNDTLSASNVNTKDSMIKEHIELWYKNNMLNVDSYIDDVIYCNDRTIENGGAFDPSIPLTSRSIFSENLMFKELDDDNKFTCPRLIDRFSVSNSSAKLKYKVGLPTRYEAGRITANISTGTMTPKQMYDGYSEIWVPNSWVGTYNDIPLKPTIALKKGMKYSSGTGSEYSPYIIVTG